eukprot:982778-Pelagomonas_calceolata.AAC.3
MPWSMWTYCTSLNAHSGPVMSKLCAYDGPAALDGELLSLLTTTTCLSKSSLTSWLLAYPSAKSQRKWCPHAEEDDMDAEVHYNTNMH